MKKISFKFIVHLFLLLLTVFISNSQTPTRTKKEIVLWLVDQMTLHGDSVWSYFANCDNESWNGLGKTCQISCGRRNKSDTSSQISMIYFIQSNYDSYNEQLQSVNEYGIKVNEIDSFYFMPANDRTESTCESNVGKMVLSTSGKIWHNPNNKVKDAYIEPGIWFDLHWEAEPDLIEKMKKAFRDLIALNRKSKLSHSKHHPN